MNWQYYTIPIIAALIGWVTNWIAVKMLFRPRKKIKILFLEIQGIFPKRQYALAEKIGKMVADELLSVQDLKEKMSHPENVAVLTKNIEGKIDDYLKTTFPSKFPLMSLFIGKKTRGQLKTEFLKEVEEATPVVIEQYLNNMEGSLNIERIIREKVALLSPVKLENLINSILKKEFKFIEFIGGVLGFLIGLLQIWMASLSA